jgi:rubrerythrin
MANEKIVKKLTDLTQLDIDAAHAYDQALKHIDNKEHYNNIARFRDDHIDHINDLSAMIRQYGGTPPEVTKDFKGYLIEGMTAIRSLTGITGALKAMETNEVLTNKTYNAALSDEEANWPNDVLQLLRKNYADEIRHLEYIRQAINILESVKQ